MSLHRSEYAHRRTRRLSAERLEARRLLAIDVQQLAEINNTNPWQTLSTLTEIGGQAYFVANEPGSNHLDLWVTDGTSAGTTRLVDLGPIGSYEFLQKPFANVGGTLFFVGYDDAHGRELWKSDGTAEGTLLVKDFRAGTGHSAFNSFVNRSGALLFSVDGDLARSNGTTEGTFRVKNLRLGSRNDEVQALTLVGNTVYFTARHDEDGIDLFKTNGTAAGTVMVVDGGADIVSNPANVAGELYFVKNQQTLWKLNGDAAELVSDFSSPPLGTPPEASPDHLTDVDGTLFFASHGDLWKSDGTAAGTQFLGRAGVQAYGLFNMDGRLYFSGGNRLLSEGGSGYELWTSDGTAAGTMMVKDLTPDFFEGYADSSYPSHLTDFNGALYFMAAGGIWTTDGTAEGTTLIEGGSVASLLKREDTLLFSRRGAGFNTSSLWKSDGSPGSAVEIPRLGPGAGNADPSKPVNVNGTLYFAANDGVIGSELWKLVGSTASLVKDIGPGSAGSAISNLTNVRGTLYFTANDSLHGQELWKSDGTADGTVMLSDMTGAFNSTPQQLTVVGDQLFFAAFDDEGWELWKSDGTAAGTLRVKDILPGSTYEQPTTLPNSSFPGDLVNLKGTLYFAATTAEGGRELWKSDGTAEGTVMVKDLFPGRSPYYPYDVYSSNVAGLTNFKGTLFFTATDPVNGRGLWKSDGTAAGTVAVKGTPQGLTNAEQLTVASGSLYFVGTSSDGAELWKSDGTTAGTVQVKDIRAGSLSSNISQLTNVTGRLFFVAGDGVFGRELWQSDGTSAGTLLVRDIRQGLDVGNYPRGSSPADLTNLNGVLFFSADDGTGGRELWKSSGASGETVRVSDIAPGATSSSPSGLAARGTELLFSAATASGRELWRARSQRPQLSVAPNTFTYTEDGPARRLASTGIVADPDTPVLIGGRLTIAITNARPGDRLELLSAASISTAGQLVLHNSVVIGRFSGGVNSAALSIELNQNAVLPAVQSLLRSVAFRSTSENPATDQRIIRFYLTDGEGAAALSQSVRVDVVQHNDRPVLGLGGTVGYVHDQPAITLAPYARVSDVDSANFDMGRLRVWIDVGAAGSNRLAIGGGFSVDADRNVRWGDVIIGRRISSGFGTSELTVVFNVNATPAVVQLLVRSITFKTVGGLAGQRNVVFTVSDGDGGLSTQASKLVNVT